MSSPKDDTTSTKALLSWGMYDWANSSFSAIIQTFVFAAYFTKQVAVNETTGTAQWGFINSMAAFIIAFSAPILGAIADHGKHRKVWIILFTYLCIFATSMLWFVAPDPSNTFLALFLVGVAIITSELAFVFYNAMLPTLASSERIGRWSGIGWSMGYAGGMLSLILALFAFINDTPLVRLDRTQALDIRAAFPLVGIWYFLFSIPLFLFTPDTSGKGKKFYMALREGMIEFYQSITNIRRHKHIVRFLIAHMFYIDGLTTLFAFGGVYAATTFGMAEREILLFGISLHVTSGIGAALFAAVDDAIGSKRLILLSLLGLIIPTGLLLLVKSSSQFWALGLFIGIFVGPVQSASRSFIARLAPKELRNEMFGFFALSGKATAFLGPLSVGAITYFTGSLTVGMSLIIVFYLIGMGIMFTVPDPKQ